RHFHGEKLRHELRMGARKEDLRTALLAPYVINISTDAVAIAESFAWDQFVTPHDGFAAAQIHDNIAIFDPLDSTVDDLADPVFEFIILAVALGFAHFLHDNLFGRLRGDPSEIHGRQLISDEVTNLRIWITVTRHEKRNL